jgi:ArsR family transcriptional regulator, virulence genes transcriptional regulator
MNPEKMKASASAATELLKLLSHRDRLLVLCQLKTGEQSVGQLAKSLDIKQSPLSQHLARMRHAGVVACRRDGQTMYYSLVGEEVEKLVSVLYELFCEE